MKIKHFLFFKFGTMLDIYPDFDDRKHELVSSIDIRIF